MSQRACYVQVLRVVYDLRRRVRDFHTVAVALRGHVGDEAGRIHQRRIR